MTMTALLASLVTDLRALLTCPVERYYDTRGPSELTCYLQPVQEDAETEQTAGNNFLTGWEIWAYIEAPWDGKAATGDGIHAVCDAIKAWVVTNRSYVPGYIATCGLAPCMRVSRSEGALETYMIALPLLFKPPQT